MASSGGSSSRPGMNNNITTFHSSSTRAGSYLTTHKPCIVSEDRGFLLQIAISETHGCLRDDTGTAVCTGLSRIGPGMQGVLSTSDQDEGWLRAAEGQVLDSICCGDGFTCGITADEARELRCWSRCSPGEPGSICATPAGAFAKLACGPFHACAVEAVSGRVHCWGEDGVGQASPPEVLHACCFQSPRSAVHCVCPFEPARRMMSACWQGTFVDVSAGLLHSCAIRGAQDESIAAGWGGGRAECWGSNHSFADQEGPLAWQAVPPATARFIKLSAGEVKTLSAWTAVHI